MTEITLGEAAEILGVSRSRAATMARSGLLGTTTRIGRNVMVSAAAAHRAAIMPRRRGRPLTQRQAWAALSLLSGRPADWVSPAERTRLRHLLRRVTAEDLGHLLRNRATVHRYRTVGDVADELRPLTLTTGRNAPADLLRQWGLAHAPLGRTVEGYVKADQLARFENRFALISDTDGEITLRAVTVREPFASHDVPDAGIALDLSESFAVRERVAGLQELARLVERFGFDAD